MIYRIAALSVLMIFIGLVCPDPAIAQTDAEYLSAINFRFSNPGARARGMGGILVALAGDDATAAFVNPGGLAFLEDNQFTLEYVSEEDEFPSPRVETGFSNGGPAMPPARRQIETDSELISFASYVYAVPNKKRGFSVFYANLFDTDTGSVEAFTDSAIFPQIDSMTGFRPFASTVAAKNEIVGISYGQALGDEFALGVSLGVSRFDFFGQSRRSEIFAPDIFINAQTSVVDEETDVFVTVGGLWQITENWSLGGSWQKETGYDMSNSSEIIITDPSIPVGSFMSEFTIPTRYALGLVYGKGRWTVGFEADFIQYSDLLTETETFFGDDSDDPEYGYAIDDVVELHVGVERIFTTKNGKSWSFRAGVWRDQAHVPYYTGTDALNLAWAPELDEDIFHATIGVGYESEQFIFGVAADFSSDAGTDVLASVIIRGKGDR